MAVKSLSRAEANKEIRRVLVKNSVDTSKVFYSCSGRTISMTGMLVKEGGQELTANNIENIVREVARLGFSIYCELQNWSISEGSISKKASAEDQKKSGARDAAKSGAPKSEKKSA